MNTQFYQWMMTSQQAIAIRERAMFLADQQALLKAAQRRRDWEYRAAVMSDIRYWGWIVVLVALLAGGGGWWLRGTLAPTAANLDTGILSATPYLYKTD
ncbi:MAG: hypothetical protein HC768_14405 [Acaryochloris sp. CRU_2_0]|nr:hypothetical protein [Acaryochloris sp. CRU_2_0]